MNTAYVTFVMRNDAFVPGALTFAYALKQQGVKDDVVCMISEQVSSESEGFLKRLFNHVLRFQEVKTEHQAAHERQDRRYLFSRFEALRLGRDGDLGVGYDKIILCDADVLPLREYESLKALKAPAGILNEAKDHGVSLEGHQYVYPENLEQTGTWVWHDIYQDYPHGTRIPKDITDRVLHDPDNMGLNASVFVLKPSLNLLRSIEHDLTDPKWLEHITRFPWPEMQYLTAKLSGQWHNLDLKYSGFNGYPGIKYLNGIHYAGLKPWQIKHRSIQHFAAYDDFKLWYHVWTEMVKKTPEVLQKPAHKKIQTFIQQQFPQGIPIHPDWPAWSKRD